MYVTIGSHFMLLIGEFLLIALVIVGITLNVSDKVYQLLAHGRWFSSGTPASCTTKTGRYDIAEILSKVALKYKKKRNQIKCDSASNVPKC